MSTTHSSALNPKVPGDLMQEAWTDLCKKNPLRSLPGQEDQSARLAASAEVDQVVDTQLGDYFVPAGGVVLGTCIQVGVAYPFGSSGDGYFLSDEFGWAWWPTLGEMAFALSSRIAEQRA